MLQICPEFTSNLMKIQRDSVKVTNRVNRVTTGYHRLTL